MLTTDRAGRLAGPGSQPQRQCPFTRSAGCGPLTCRNGVESGHGRASSHVPFRDAAGPAALSLEEGSTFMSTWVFFLGGGGVRKVKVLVSRFGSSVLDYALKSRQALFGKGHGRQEKGFKTPDQPGPNAPQTELESNFFRTSGIGTLFS